MNTHLEQVTDAWQSWTIDADPALLDLLDNVRLDCSETGGYDIHLTAYDVDQFAVDCLAASLGFESNSGWEPNNGRTVHQWSITGHRGSPPLLWVLTAVLRPADDGSEGGDQ